MTKVWQSWRGEREDTLRKLWAENVPARKIAVVVKTSVGGVYAQARKLNLPVRNLPRGRAASRLPGQTRPARDVTRQRRFTGSANSEGPKVVLNPWDPRARAGITIFPQSVLPASMRPQIIKSGEHSRKLGSVVEKGPWKGMPIFSLTLEERATCPRSCLEWAHCYGNNMPFAHRTSDDGTLTRRLWGELASLNAAHPNGLVLRLHVLGDFYSVDYVHFWRQALHDFPALRIFGFTARIPPDPIGVALVPLAMNYWERFKVRFSGGKLPTHCSEVVEREEEATGILCPAEKNADISCASCGLCLNSNRTISFKRH